MQIINIIVLGFVSRLLGGAWDNQIPRLYIILPLSLYILFATIPDLMQFGAIMYLFTVARLLPTNGLLSAIHGSYPTRTDGKWQFLQDMALKIWRFFPEKCQSWYLWAIIYGVVRNMLALPAIIFLGWPAYLLLAQGLIYWLCGKLSKSNGNKVAEVLTGAIIGACIV